MVVGYLQASWGAAALKATAGETPAPLGMVVKTAASAAGHIIAVDLADHFARCCMWCLQCRQCDVCACLLSNAPAIGRKPSRRKFSLNVCNAVILQWCLRVSVCCSCTKCTQWCIVCQLGVFMFHGLLGPVRALCVVSTTQPQSCAHTGRCMRCTLCSRQLLSQP